MFTIQGIIMKRRVLLALCASTPLITAGCLDRISASDGPVQLCSVSFSNAHSEPCEGDIRILEDDTVVVKQSEEIAAAEEGVVGGVETTIEGGFAVPDEDLPAEPGHYTIQMRVTGSEWEHQEEFSTSDTDQAYVSLIGRIENRPAGGEDNVVFGIARVTDPEWCGTE